MIWNDNPNPDGLRVIKTARTEGAINAAAATGLRPLVKPVQPLPEIRSKLIVFQHRATGAIRVEGDYRVNCSHSDWETVLDWTKYYPHSFPSPYAAYLIPPDLTEGERVYVEDLIEDFVGATWNQGDVYRLEGCDAIWNGKDLEIQYDAAKRSDFMG